MLPPADPGPFVPGSTPPARFLLMLHWQEVALRLGRSLDTTETVRHNLRPRGIPGVIPLPVDHGGVVSEDTLLHKVSVDVTWCYDAVPISIGEIEHNALNDELIRVVRNKALRTGAGFACEVRVNSIRNGKERHLSPCFHSSRREPVNGDAFIAAHGGPMP